MIKIEKNGANGDLTKTVNARELHQFLEVGRDFSTWIKGRIEQYGFEEGVDFYSFLSESSGGRSSKECAFDSPELGNQTSGRGGDRIDQYNFIENLDQVVIAETGNNPLGGRPSKEYAISIDLAKTVNTRSISKYSFVEETDFCSFLSESSSGYQF